MAQRAELVAPIDREIAEIDKELGRQADASADATAHLASITQTIVRYADEMIGEGLSPSTSQIRQRIEADGVELPGSDADAERRITKTLSANGRFKGHRGLGWSRKGEDPGTTGSSGATELPGSKK